MKAAEVDTELCNGAYSKVSSGCKTESSVQDTSHRGTWLGIRHGRLVLSLSLGIVLGALAWYLLIKKFGPSSSPLIIKARPAVGARWPDGRGTVGVSMAFPDQILVNQSCMLAAHVTFFVVGPDISPPVLANPDYEIFINAHLDSPAFDIRPTAAESQLAKGGLMSWSWMALPKQAGPQLLDLTMDVDYKSKHPGGQSLPTMRLWSSGPKVVLVEEPWIKRGQIDLVSIVVGALSSLVAGLWEKLFPKTKAP